MRFDFTTVPDRHGHDAIAIDGLGEGSGFASATPKEGFDSIPLGVADMSFATAPSVTRAMHERIDHPFFGYYAESDAYYQAINRDAILASFDEEIEGNIGSSDAVVSAGISVFDPTRDTSFHDVFERADALMYQRKMQLKSMGATTRD